MLTALTTGLRFKLAILFAIFASLCFVAPPAVLAFGHGAATVDCMAHADKVGHGKMATTQETKHHGSFDSGRKQAALLLRAVLPERTGRRRRFHR